MSKLIQMRRRIKAIETIKKITHAMRLISMSAHSRLKYKQQTVAEYVHAIEQLFNNTLRDSPDWTHPIMQPPTTSKTTLIIIIGSQKGLCGHFNTVLLNRFITHTDLNSNHNYAIISVGKKVTDMLKTTIPHALIDIHEQFTTRTFLDIAHKLVNHITTQTTPYAKVIIWSNIAKSFFVQKPEETILIPFNANRLPDKQRNQITEYTWEYPAQEILGTLAQQYLESHIEQLLFESLLAEQAARFISMDGSTRNAQNLLDETRLQYNKIRQAKITKELTELIGSF